MTGTGKKKKKKFKDLIKFSLNKEEVKDKEDTSCFRKIWYRMSNTETSCRSSDQKNPIR